MRSLPLLALLLAPFARAAGRPTEVAVLGTIHGGHLGSKGYSVRTVIDTVRAYRPDVVFVEIPPDLFEPVVRRVDRTGFRTRRKDLEDRPWIKAFPEIYRGILPLRKEMGYTVVPVSGWRPEVSGDRREFWNGPGREPRMVERRRIYDAVRSALHEIHERERSTENPAFVNSRHYADLWHLERTLWSVCFDEGLGRGGEVAINRAHWSNIARALDRYRGQRILIVYGAAHRYWFLRELRQRTDVRLVDVRGFLPR
ncbi:MAG: hypothetical protein ACE5JG_02265 [Planctomycetota bacterium]